MCALTTVSQYLLLVMAILMVAGGVIGFVKASSKPSLIAGTISGALLAACFAFSFCCLQSSLVAAAIIFLLLEVVFAIRLRKTKKLMPSGMMLILVSIAEIIVIISLLDLFNVI